MNQGTALIHDGLISHGVEPVLNGTRYSLITFFSVGRADVTFVNARSEVHSDASPRELATT